MQTQELIATFAKLLLQRRPDYVAPKTNHTFEQPESLKKLAELTERAQKAADSRRLLEEELLLEQDEVDEFPEAASPKAAKPRSLRKADAGDYSKRRRELKEEAKGSAYKASPPQAKDDDEEDKSRGRKRYRHDSPAGQEPGKTPSKRQKSKNLTSINHK